MPKIDPTRRTEIGRERRAKTQARLVEAARVLFTSRSIASITVEDVTRQARLAKGTFYSHFRRLDDLRAAHVEDRRRRREDDDGEVLLYGDGPVVLAGHLDTVPAQGNIPGRIEAGAVRGLGASDMKGGVAVMIELARWIAEERPELAFDPAFLFFAREELALEESPLPEVFAAAPLVRESALVIVLEPTDNALHLGCLRKHEDINAVIHSHAMHCTMFAVTHQPIPCVIEEVASNRSSWIISTGRGLPA